MKCDKCRHYCGMKNPGRMCAMGNRVGNGCEFFLDRKNNPREDDDQSTHHGWRCPACGELTDTSPCQYCGHGFFRENEIEVDPDEVVFGDEE